MARKRGRNRKLEEIAETAPPAARRFSRDNPLAAGGTVVMALTGTLIVANAVGFQPGRHPAPLFQSRDHGEAPGTDAAPGTVAPGIAGDGTQPADIVATTPVQQISTLILDIQTELRSQNLYEGPLDGLKGPATERAIRNYQRIIGQVETGEPSEALLAVMTLQKVAPTSGPGGEPGLVPVPRGKPGASSRALMVDRPAAARPPAPPATARNAAPATAPAATPPAPTGAAAAGQSPKPAATPVPPQDIRLVQIQQVLSDLGYGPLAVDGVMGANTSAAIRRFQLDRGLALTGVPSPQVIERLEMVSGKKISG